MYVPKAISVYVICGSRYLLLRRCEEFLFGTWQMVTGGVESGETAWQAAIREIGEECGFAPDRLYSADCVEIFYDKESNEVVHCPVFAAFVDTRKQVLLSPKEHDAFEWLPMTQAKDRLFFADQKRTLAHVHENFVLKSPAPFHLIRSVGNGFVA